MDYVNDPSGHRLANRSEAQLVEEMGVDLDAYDEHLDPQLKKIEKLPLHNVPKDLALYPYTSDEALLDRIREGQYSVEEEEEEDEPYDYDTAEVDYEPSGPSKIHRDAFLYMDNTDNVEDFAQCKTCATWVNRLCLVLDKLVNPEDTCGLYTLSAHQQVPEPIAIAKVSPIEAGFLEATDVRCENCYYGGARCGLFNRLNQTLPETFDLKEEINPKGCCNAWTPK
jgi:hypothetical protein